jgi:hypothetical protein
MAARTVLPCITALALPPNGGNREALPAGPAVSFMRLVRQKRRTVARALSVGGPDRRVRRAHRGLPSGRCLISDGARRAASPPINPAVIPPAARPRGGHAHQESGDRTTTLTLLPN